MYERGMGSALGTVGAIAGMGTGMVPGIGLYSAGRWAGTKAGRILDRLRAGASLGTAISAPSPNEAAAQLAKIQQHYGTL